MFAGVVNVNSTASNATVPSGLWAIPTLGDLPLIGNGSFPAGRRKRSVKDNGLEQAGDLFDMEEDLYLRDFLSFKKDLDPLLRGHQSAENITGILRSVLTATLLMDRSDECQAALGCRSQTFDVLIDVDDKDLNSRLGYDVKENRGPIMSSSLDAALKLISPLQWTTFTEVFAETKASDNRDRRECERFKCQLCLSM